MVKIYCEKGACCSGEGFFSFILFVLSVYFLRLMWVKLVCMGNGWQLNSSAAFSGDRSMEKR